MPFIYGTPRIFGSQMFFEAGWACLLHYKGSSLFYDPRLDCKTQSRINNFCILCHNHRCTAFQSCCTCCICLSSPLYLGWLQLEIQSPVLNLCKMPCFVYSFAPGERPRCLFSACEDSLQSSVNAGTGPPLRKTMLSSAPMVLHFFSAQGLWESVNILRTSL